MNSRFAFFIVLCALSAVSCYAGEQEIQEAAAAIEGAFGVIQRDGSGKITAVDLAADRASADDNVFKKTLQLPQLKSLRVAGGTITPQTFAMLKEQTALTDLYLKEITVNDADLNAALTPLTQLKRLTLRRLPNVTAIPKLPNLRNLSLLELSFTEKTFFSLLENKLLTALDLRGCSGLTEENYQSLKTFEKLTDLKIGGFAVNDETLKAVTPLPNLTGLTLDDTCITPESLAAYIADSPSAQTLHTLVINKGTLLDDDLFVLNQLQKLNRLTLSDMMITGTVLVQWAQGGTVRPKLKILSLKKTLLTEEGAAALKKFGELQTLDLSYTNVTPPAAAVVVTLPNLKTLYLTGCGLDEAAENVLKGNNTIKVVR
ncbi:MAG: hypothetical protein LBT46_06045 [Planctomycetaceae bacterium]|jgi:hypothetical protein|nr:hypothetical protein [Planctomycetaceae bacterium]